MLVPNSNKHLPGTTDNAFDRQLSKVKGLPAYFSQAGVSGSEALKASSKLCW